MMMRGRSTCRGARPTEEAAGCLASQLARASEIIHQKIKRSKVGRRRCGFGWSRGQSRYLTLGYKISHLRHSLNFITKPGYHTSSIIYSLKTAYLQATSYNQTTTDTTMPSRLEAKQAHAAGDTTPDSHSQVDAGRTEKDPFAEGEVDFRTVGWMKGELRDMALLSVRGNDSKLTYHDCLC